MTVVKCLGSCRRRVFRRPHAPIRPSRSLPIEDASGVARQFSASDLARLRARGAPSGPNYDAIETIVDPDDDPIFSDPYRRCGRLFAMRLAPYPSAAWSLEEFAQ